MVCSISALERVDLVWKLSTHYPHYEDNEGKQYLHKLNSLLQPTCANNQHFEIVGENPLFFWTTDTIRFVLSIERQIHSTRKYNKTITLLSPFTTGKYMMYLTT